MRVVLRDLKYRPCKTSVVLERPPRLRTVILRTIFVRTTDVDKGSKSRKLGTSLVVLSNPSLTENIETRGSKTTK